MKFDQRFIVTTCTLHQGKQSRSNAWMIRKRLVFIICTFPFPAERRPTLSPLLVMKSPSNFLELQWSLHLYDGSLAFSRHLLRFQHLKAWRRCVCQYLSSLDNLGSRWSYDQSRSNVQFTEVPISVHVRFAHARIKHAHSPGPLMLFN